MPVNMKGELTNINSSPSLTEWSCMQKPYSFRNIPSFPLDGVELPHTELVHNEVSSQTHRCDLKNRWQLWLRRRSSCVQLWIMVCSRSGGFANCLSVWVISHLDYCNVFHIRLPLKGIQKLQPVQNSEAWAIKDISPFAYVTNTSASRAVLAACLFPIQFKCWLSPLNNFMA